MASSSGSDENMQQQSMDQMKRKRMQSNRESAKRSRMRKQKHVDDLTAQVAQLAKENDQILTAINVAKQSFMIVEADNSVLRAQMMELARRLKSLNEILDHMDSSAATTTTTTTTTGGCLFGAEDFQHQGFGDGFMNNPWPVMASVDMFDYC